MRSLALIGAGIAALVVAAVAVVLLAGDRRAEVFPADTPQGTFQRYLAAFEEGDVEAAYAFLSSRVQERVSFDDYERQFDDYSLGYPDGGPVRQVLFNQATGGDDRTTLHLTIDELYGEGLSTSRNSYGIQVRMVREAGEWRVDEPLVGLQPGYFPALPEG